MIYTTHLFKKLPEGVRMVCIARFPPDRYHGLIDLRLAPQGAWLKLDREEYARLFNEMLAKLDLKKIAAEWDGCAFGCYCRLDKPGAWCHRELLAAALQAEGVKVEELP
jgi:hypothetical protein